MNKIVLNFGLLIFFLSMIFFVQLDYSLYDVILKSLIIFVVVTLITSVIVLVFIKAINKTAKLKKSNLNYLDDDYDE